MRATRCPKGGKLTIETGDEIREDFMSGYTENAIVHQGTLDTGIEYVQKPRVPDALARRGREILRSPGRGPLRAHE